MAEDKFDIGTIGKPIGKIPVELGYKIIDLFSGHLYSNPAKALEELIINSYDAFAENCNVFLPENLDEPQAKVIVWDNGDSMDKEGLRELWMIADSKKRDPDREKDAAKRGRLPIGKFGIGKLASYTIGRRISHVCKNKGKFLVVTMDYSDLFPDDPTSIESNPKIKSTTLDVRELTESQAKEALSYAASGELPGGEKLPLFGKGAPDSWTLVVVDHLKPKVREIHRGQLKWIISTALPLVPDFKVGLNGAIIEPSKLKQKVLKRWQIGSKDKVAEKLGFANGTQKDALEPFNKWVEIPGVGKIHGELQLFEDTLTGGKAEEHGRSHGFFIKVRHRLVNYKDEVFGSHALAHQTLNRLNAVVYADGLDPTLVASREGVSTAQQDALLKYVIKKFYEIRDWYEDFLTKKAKEETMAERVQSVPPPLVSLPLQHAVESASGEGAPAFHTISRPPATGKIQTTIKGYETGFLEPHAPIAMFNPSTGIVTLNEAHPFCANYRDSLNLHVIATAEIMTEAYMLEAGIPPEKIRVVMRRRDDLLRELVRATPEGVDMVAQRIRDAGHDEDELEHACHAAFRALGFEVTPLGGSGKPDGLASAELGMTSPKGGGAPEPRSYTIAYDAKSTGSDKVKSAHLDLAGIKRHREKFKAKYSVVIAPGYEGEDNAESKGNVEAAQQVVTLLRAKDLARLIEASGRLPMPLDGLRDFFEKCRTALESSKWVDTFASADSDEGVDRMLLDAIWKIQKEENRDPPQIPVVRELNPSLKKFSTGELVERLKSIERLVPQLVVVYDTVAYLNQPPEKVVYHIRQRLRAMKPAKGLGKKSRG